jgi:hypothetical protein
LLLPESATSDWLRATAIVLAGSMVVLAVVFAVAGIGVAVGIAVVLALLAGLGVAVPALVRPVYRCNLVVLRAVARVVRAVAQASCFGVVTSARLTGTSLVDDAGSRSSGWTPKRSMPSDSYAHPFPHRGVTHTSSWAPGYARWATSTGNAWAVGLVPFLALMRSAQETEDHELRGEIYALY